MAEGRMIVQSISRDPRIAGLSLFARALWPYAFAHCDSNGLLPRDPEELRLLCIPNWTDTTKDHVETAILEWFAANGPKGLMAREVEYKKDKYIELLDFEKCNWNLSVFKMRRARSNNVTNKSHSDQCDQCDPEVNRSEVKGSEVKNNNKQHIASFERFWKDYPRKEGRKPALEVWLKLRPEEETVTLLLQALLKYKSCADVRRGIVLSAARWLTEERWTDEIGEDGNGDPIYA